MTNKSKTKPVTVGSNAWLARIFKAKQVREGNSVRRAKRDVERLISTELLISEVTKRGFHLLQIGTQYVVVCNKGQLQVLC
jgi:hypothetical protein